MKPNTSLTDVEIRWLTKIYNKEDAIRKKGMGIRKITEHINIGRRGAGKKTISRGVVENAVKKIGEGIQLVSSNPSLNRTIKCPKCNHRFEVTR